MYIAQYHTGKTADRQADKIAITVASIVQGYSPEEEVHTRIDVLGSAQELVVYGQVYTDSPDITDAVLSLGFADDVGIAVEQVLGITLGPDSLRVRVQVLPLAQEIVPPFYSKAYIERKGLEVGGPVREVQLAKELGWALEAVCEDLAAVLAISIDEIIDGRITGIAVTGAVSSDQLPLVIDTLRERSLSLDGRNTPNVTVIPVPVASMLTGIGKSNNLLAEDFFGIEKAAMTTGIHGRTKTTREVVAATKAYEYAQEQLQSHPAADTVLVELGYLPHSPTPVTAHAYVTIGSNEEQVDLLKA